jgi:hypothetical protein
MGGLAFLPWEEWIGRLVNECWRFADQQNRKRSLSMSATWPETQGIVASIDADSRLSRERIVYSYSTDSGYYSGFYWRWLDPSEVRYGQTGDKVLLRYDPKENGNSVFLGFS